MGFDSDISFNSINVDGEISTNDLIYILENGAASNGFIIDKRNTKEVFKRESTDFATDPTKLVVRDGKNTTLLRRCKVTLLLIWYYSLIFFPLAEVEFS